MAARFCSDADNTQSISKSIFVTNFPNNTTSKDLWEVCKAYEKVVDVYISNRLSKAGKRFTFVRFIKVANVDRLVSNMCTLWIGRMHLHANIVRFERSPIAQSRVNVPTRRDNYGFTSFASILKGNVFTSAPILYGPALVLDDTCEVNQDLDLYVMGELKHFSSINNVRVLLANEGFNTLNIAYLGGLWVLIELDFGQERVVWVDIEGVPLHAWSCNTFKKIGSKWEEMMDLEEGKDALFARKRICIKTSQEDNILEKFKITIRRKTFVVRAKELFAWTPVFKVINDVMAGMDDIFDMGDDDVRGKDANTVNSDNGSEVEGVSDTIFGDHEDNPSKDPVQNTDHVQEQTSQNMEASQDPFNIYDLLRSKKLEWLPIQTLIRASPTQLVLHP
uniref:RRM domain-containing protein n=1 Tax=Tanacetum cinerariifolium TaxID=118510 RepID=A0A699LCU2_TANCI|nr:hypothetical protein CTI12_AA041880 [Tanacetum cinerariifolium]